jgi:hypothetical protein
MVEEEYPFSAPFRVVFRRGAREFMLTSAGELAEVLMDPLWPVHGPAYFEACDMVMAFLEGRDDVSIQEVCEAFAAAVDEAERHSSNPIEVDCDPLN